MKVEHVLLFLVGAFLVYHMMGDCGCKRVEGFPCDVGRVGCNCHKDAECLSEWCDMASGGWDSSTCQNPNYIFDTLDKDLALVLQRRCPGPAADGTVR